MTSYAAQIKTYFFKVNRRITAGLIAVLIASSVFFWYTGDLSVENSSVLIGSVLMLLAVVFYQIPFISFLLTRRHFDKHDHIGLEILEADWKTFRKWLEA